MLPFKSKISKVLFKETPKNYLRRSGLIS